jgi:DNA polymerase III delta prime subunit
MNNESPVFIPKRNQPPDHVDDFVGRDAEISRLFEFFSTVNPPKFSGKVASIWGDPGTGKTALALALARKLGQEYPDGHLVIGSGGRSQDPLFITETFETVIHSLDPFALLSDDLAELHSLYILLLQHKRLLIIVDQALDQENVKLLVPPGKSALILISEDPIDFPNLLSLQIHNLPSEHAEEFITRMYPEGDSQVAALAQVCKKSPLALHLSLGLLSFKNDFRIENIVDLLSDLKSKRTKFNPITSLITLLYENLNPTDQQIFCQLAIFSFGFDQSDAVGVVTIDGKHVMDLGEHLGMLTRAKLLAFDKITGLYRMHDSARTFALKRLKNPTDAYLCMAAYYGEFSEDLAMFSIRGFDGLLMSLLMFDECKGYIKQIWAWLLRQKVDEKGIDKIIVQYFKFIEIFGKMRFFPRNELIPQLKCALAAAEFRGDQQVVGKILKELEKNNQQPS